MHVVASSNKIDDMLKCNLTGYSRISHDGSWNNSVDELIEKLNFVNVASHD